MSIQGLFPLRLTDLISLLSKELSGVSPAPQFEGINSLALCLPSLWSSSHIHTRLLENHSFDYMDFCQQSDVSAFENAV